MKMVDEYKKKSDYSIARQLVKDFTSRFLDGDIYKLQGLDLEGFFNEHNSREVVCKYVGKIKDPDMFLISQAIYIVVWGHIYNLEFKKLGRWGSKNQYPFRGDTMNSFNSVYGVDSIIANTYVLSKEMRDKICDYRKLYHSIGNFIVIPNRNNVNRKRANYYTMQDYFDWFVGAFYYYEKPSEKTVFSEFDAMMLEKMRSVFQANLQYKEILFDKWIEKFFLEDYVVDGKPINVFKIDLQVRMKEYVGRKKRSSAFFYSTKEYRELSEQYYINSEKIITYRAKKICDALSSALGEL